MTKQLHELAVPAVPVDPFNYLVSEIAVQSHGGPNVEPPTAARWEALISYPGPAVQNLVHESANYMQERGIGNGPAVSGLRTSIVYYARARSAAEGTEFSDLNLLSPQDWLPVFDMLEEDLCIGTSDVAETFLSSFSYLTAKTPVLERVASINLLTQLVRDRFPNGAQGLEIGSSIMVGDLQLMYGDEFPMSLRSVQTKPARGTEHDVTEKANRLVRLPRLFDNIVAIDIFEVYHESKQRYDPLQLEYALSGLRPSERGSEHFQIVKSLVAKKEIDKPGYDSHNGVYFDTLNLLDPADVAAYKDKFPGKLDVIFLNFVTQELPLRDQVRMHDIAVDLLSPNGLLIYNHQAKIAKRHQQRPTDISNVKHLKSYATVPYSSTTHYVDMAHPELGVQQAFTSYDNRCQDLRVNPVAQLMVNGSLERVADLIKNS